MTDDTTTRLPVAVLGARGSMGTLASRAVEDADDLELVAALGRGDDLEQAAAATVVVDVTTPEAALEHVLWAVDHDKHAVVGTTGLDDAALDRVRTALADTGDRTSVLVVPNFSAAVLLARRFATMAAPYFDSAEILDLTHPRKADAPSGTAVQTARDMARARREAALPASADATEPGSRQARGAAVEDVHVHSIRMPGFVSHTEVLLSSASEMLTIRSDTSDRGAFMPGLLRCVRAAPSMRGLSVGLEAVFDPARG